MSIQELYEIHEKGYSICMDGDKKRFLLFHETKKIKGILGIKKESRSSNKKTLI